MKQVQQIEQRGRPVQPIDVDKYVLNIEGKPYGWDDEKITTEEIAKLGGWDPERAFLR